MAHSFIPAEVSIEPVSPIELVMSGKSVTAVITILRMFYFYFCGIRSFDQVAENINERTINVKIGTGSGEVRVEVDFTKMPDAGLFVGRESIFVKMMLSPIRGATNSLPLMVVFLSKAFPGTRINLNLETGKQQGQ